MRIHILLQLPGQVGTQAPVSLILDPAGIHGIQDTPGRRRIEQLPVHLGPTHALADGQAKTLVHLGPGLGFRVILQRVLKYLLQAQPGQLVSGLVAQIIT
ncbi:hypothetical protein D9M68_614960 [compost metagenome]